MQRKMTSIFLALVMLMSMAVPAFAVESQDSEELQFMSGLEPDAEGQNPDEGDELDAVPQQGHDHAVYLGVKDYGTVTGGSKDDFQHRFYVDGEERLYTVSSEGNYAIQNTLQEGYIYSITVDDNTVTQAELLDRGSRRMVMGTVDSISQDTITVDGIQLTMEEGTQTYEIATAAGGASVEEAAVSEGDSVKVVVDSSTAKAVYKAFVAEDYTPPVSGTPGKRTLKNFLATALEPVGTGLYVYGGTWDWQDMNSSNQAMTIGIPQSWIDFFQSRDEHYSYKNSSDPAHSYYPHKSWNQYYYAGVDCSGYVGWVVYNVINTKDSTVADSNGYVMSSTKMAKTFAETYDWGTWSRSTEDGFHVGDVFSMSGHVWICLGVCDDGSIVFLHSTPSESKTGESGGGIQISALNPVETKDCEAYRLADYYMTKYYPQWSERYDAVLRTYSSYTAIASNANAGKFTWDLSGDKLLSDPDGYANMTPAQILADLFGEKPDDNDRPSGSSSTSTYSITVSTSVDNGTVTLSTKRTQKGSTVTITVKPDSGYELDRLTVKDKGGNTVKVTDEGNGKYTFIMPASQVTVKPVFTEVDDVVKSEFRDVSTDSWYYDAVTYVAEHGIMTGVSTGFFDPETKLTRGMLAQILYNLEDAPAGATAGFLDVAPGDWYADAVNWAAAKGIVSGYGNGIFGPKDNVTREQMAVILYQYAVWKGYDTDGSAALSKFADANQTSGWAVSAVEWAVGCGLISGRADGILDAQGFVTRAEAAAVLMNFVQLVEASTAN